MKREQMPLYALALAILVVGLAFVGVSVGSLLIAGLVLACPLMMMFMMRGMSHGDDHQHDATHRSDSARDRDDSRR